VIAVCRCRVTLLDPGMSCQFYVSPPSARKTPAYAMSQRCRCRGVAPRRVLGAVYSYTGRMQRSASV